MASRRVKTRSARSAIADDTTEGLETLTMTGCGSSVQKRGSATGSFILPASRHRQGVSGRLAAMLVAGVPRPPSAGRLWRWTGFFGEPDDPMSAHMADCQ